MDILMGAGKGNGMGPEIWAVISTLFFDVLRKNSYGFLLTVPFSQRKLDITSFGFLDDTNLIHTSLSRDNYWGIASKL